MSLWISLAFAGGIWAWGARSFAGDDARQRRFWLRLGAGMLIILFVIGWACKAVTGCETLGWTAPWVGAVQAVFAAGLIARFLLSSVAMRGHSRRSAQVNPLENPIAPRRVELSTDFHGPAAWRGWGQGRVLFPKFLWDQLDRGARELILFHEDAHLRGGDIWWRWALTAAWLLSLGNPGFWWLRRELIRVDEFVADDEALARSGADGADLIRTFLQVDRLSPSAFGLHERPAGAAGFPGELRARSERLLERRGPPRRTSGGAAVLLFGAWLLATATASAFEARVVRAEISARGLEIRRTEVKFGILNPLLESDDWNYSQPQCRRNP